jgi:hypothetical protein
MDKIELFFRYPVRFDIIYTETAVYWNVRRLISIPRTIELG